ncbi:peptidase S51 dipeptidase E [Arthrobacter psychrochitiniphilus]|uniref:Peptidase S51 dipeptidase E n=2 Tax=Arthrobacter psychrochitiniphilus TaxID=291045 RepID=A0A2V3DW60_9MICC|nr:peptidase S51 dipeptidase E [Arthrobacter psychrochitiniphilus]
MGDMKMLLLSRFVGAVPEFLGGVGTGSRADIRIAYIDDASQPLGDAPFVGRERTQLQDLGYSVVPVTIGDGTAADLATVLDSVNAVYVAGGMADHLMDVLRRTGADSVLVERVRAGLPYIGASAGAMIAGTSIDPAIALDGHTEGISLEDRSGLGLADVVILPHADGQLPPYPSETINEVAGRLKGTPGLTLLADDAGLLVEDNHLRRVDSPSTA